ncbi:MAG TPA: hypothetical protein DCL54_13290, partial [Alphaproteobacteria bacterium]|nr:hypothetical protein [Alphaproteobacteria bacterium]
MGEFDRHLTVTALAPAQALRLWRQKASLPELRPGWVWLVGAGPGDAAYLTLAAIDALAQADVVFFDALVDESVLGFAAPGAQLV